MDIKELYNFSNLCAVVTGGAGVLCAEMCRALADLGAKVAILDLNQANADKLAEELRQSGGTALGVACNVLDKESVQAACNKVLAAYGKVDILVNNAGIVDKHRPITECTDEWWNEIIAIDQSSLFYMMKDTIPHMMASGKGSIINVSSIGGVFGNGGISYSAAKSAAAVRHAA